ncbi:DNA adenine methylase [Marivibrio sp.]|uniref:DNA adenine methylase n=1 Tax=Marivibrio sp. TaxID=2039719 RepID=UPI0032ED86EC
MRADMPQSVPDPRAAIAPFNMPLLKWIGSKQRTAPLIARHFPARFGTYFEPFLGAGGVLGTLAPPCAVAGDAYGPLMGIWEKLAADPDGLVGWYRERWAAAQEGDPKAVYERMRARFNADPNGPDLLYLVRACYGGVVRFRKKDGAMSTPCGPHRLLHPDKFARRVAEWARRTEGTRFRCADFRDTVADARPGDLVYCDPPYSHAQAILYGAQAFRLADLFEEIARLKSAGVFVALSLDGAKRGETLPVDLPDGLFDRAVAVELDRSRLRRFQLRGRSVEGERVSERLLLTW